MTKRLAMAMFFRWRSLCGRVADLQPQAGKSLPQKPALAARAPDRRGVARKAAPCRSAAGR